MLWNVLSKLQDNWNVSSENYFHYYVWQKKKKKGCANVIWKRRSLRWIYTYVFIDSMISLSNYTPFDTVVAGDENVNTTIRLCSGISWYVAAKFIDASTLRFTWRGLYTWKINSILSVVWQHLYFWEYFFLFWSVFICPFVACPAKTGPVLDVVFLYSRTSMARTSLGP